MIKIDSLGNEQIANALIENAVEGIKKSFANNQPVFLACGHQSVIGGNTIEILAIVGVGLDNLFTEVQEKIGAEAANMLFDGFIESLTEMIRKNNGD